MRRLLVCLIICLAVIPTKADNVTPSDIAPIVSYLISNQVFTAKQVIIVSNNLYLPANGPAHPWSLIGTIQTNASGGNAETGSNYTITVYPAYDVANPNGNPTFGTNFTTNYLLLWSNSYSGLGVINSTSIPPATWENATSVLIVISNSLSTNATLTVYCTSAP